MRFVWTDELNSRGHGEAQRLATTITNPFVDSPADFPYNA
jgi:hypothetical protein